MGKELNIFVVSKCRCSHYYQGSGVRINKYVEDITQWQEDMNFMFEWQEQYLTSEHSERVRYCSCHEKIKFISSS